ncbi:hypothetical protein EBB79_15050 [Parasedimentitalea marina]|uniref:Uncharacterized protein n=1 Tax=Parasedimentitalea marina TaxID=2483033 RepID=A0A3T0N4W1_9RHOB|nr:hypothetical protein [Parasedimentitalea marina]AZV79058.1 hypothetical protein EBB79_15050 [Parasedimentitalea marina]
MEFLADPIYRAKYNGVMEEIHEVRTATERALDQIADQLAGTLTKIQQMQDAAAHLPDGTRVFRDENSVVRLADGSEVEGYLADTIQWTGLEPSFEDYTQKISERDDLLATQIEVQIYETDVLGAALDKLTDPDDPPTLNELDQILDNSNNAMPDAVRRHMADVSGEIGPRTSLDSSMIPQLGNT